MNVREVIWRIDQKRIQKSEAMRFGKQKYSVGVELFPEYCDLRFNADAIGLNFDNSVYGLNTRIHFLKGADKEKWPDVFSYSLDYKQRDDLGDARTNWEKNRHFDWTLLSKKCFVLARNNDSECERCLDEWKNEVETWCNENPFLHGISWTSAMEFAIRAINWMYALAFLEKTTQCNPSLCVSVSSLVKILRNGIINITDYLTKHYSRFSSANNHLLVEATAIGLAGYAFDNSQWKKLACKILSEELYKQNYADGVNKELSLHYQTFGMEAYLLLMHVMQNENNEDWKQWLPMLKKEAEFVAHSSWREKVVCEFGDDDEGKILDLQGGEWYQWDYVLQLASLVTGTRYSDFETVNENINWLFTNTEIDNIKKLPLYDATSSRCFEIGGNTFLRDKQNRILIGIDHAELGFGSIAAHGHADALSFQMQIDGKVVFADPGTYIYHCDITHRDSFRKTINHNTLCIEGKDQSKMLGAFMWGERANCRLEEWSSSDNKDILVASHDGYRPIIHRRKFEFDKINNILCVTDFVSSRANYVVTYMLGATVSVELHDSKISLNSDGTMVEMLFDGADKIAIEDAELSPEYGVKIATKAIKVYSNKSEIKTNINIQM